MTWFAPLVLWAPTLFDQSVVRILTRDFPQAQFVLVDIPTHEVLGRQWDSNGPIPMGSLLKPFTALALSADAGRAHCKPKDCWLPAGHGSVDLAGALAHSCNSYFLQKAAGLSFNDVATVASRFQLPSPSVKQPGTWIGLGSDWKVEPERMALAYTELTQAHDAGVILSGMRTSARSGTAKLLRGEALAKTGTAPCSHRVKAPGDGYVAMLYPAGAPKYVLLVQMHGVSGAEATRTAFRMLSVLRDGK